MASGFGIQAIAGAPSSSSSIGQKPINQPTCPTFIVKKHIHRFADHSGSELSAILQSSESYCLTAGNQTICPLALVSGVAVNSQTNCPLALVVGCAHALISAQSETDRSHIVENEVNNDTRRPIENQSTSQAVR